MQRSKRTTLAATPSELLARALLRRSRKAPWVGVLADGRATVSALSRQQVAVAWRTLRMAGVLVPTGQVVIRGPGRAPREYQIDLAAADKWLGREVA